MANWNGALYVAYADNSLDGKLWLTHTSDGMNFSTPIQVQLTGPQTVYTADNPSLAVFNNELYVGYVDNYGDGFFVATPDGVNFGAAILGNCGLGTATDSPSLSVFNSKLYFAYRTSSATLGLCSIDANNNVTSNTYAYSVGDSPALGVFSNTLYVAFHDNGGDHYIYLAESPDGSSFVLSTAATGSHTSTACSVAVYNNVLYIGFRQNSTGNHFYYTYSTDGASFSAPIEVGWTMGGPPALGLLNGHLYNVFRQNDTGHYLFTAYGQ